MVSEESKTPPTQASSSVFLLRDSKIHPPQLQDDILRRDRLLDWLAVKINRRVIFVVAEAGFGKTTLLADYVRRSRLRSIWYRLDDEESDGLTFLRYFVAACQIADPALMPHTAALLNDQGAAPDAEATMKLLLSELPALGDEPTAIVLDDYHLAERSTAVRELTERLLTRAPDRVSFVFASRTTPRLPVARFRARDEFGELGREELCFEPAETEQLFRDSYKQPLEADVLLDLQARTEGWPASLQLVKQALRRRTPAETRAFIRALNGAEGVLYDYLAEEVVADLHEDLRAFLLRASLLEEITADISGCAFGIRTADASRLIGEAEALGLLSRVKVETRPARFHPLVRDFFVSALRSEVGDEGISELHRRIGALLEPQSWRMAAHHWAEAGDRAQVCRVIEESAHIIVGSGEYEAADAIIARFAGPDPNPYFDIIRSRLAFARGQLTDAAELAARASAAVSDAHTPDARLAHLEALHAVYTTRRMSFDTRDSAPALSRLIHSSIDGLPAAVAAASAAIQRALNDGNLDECDRELLNVEQLSAAANQPRYEGIAHVNRAAVSWAKGDFDAVAVHSQKAAALLASCGNPDEFCSSMLHRASHEAQVGRWEAALETIETALTASPAPDDLLVAAQLHALYGDALESARLLGSPTQVERPSTLEVVANVLRARLGLLTDRDALEAVFREGSAGNVQWLVYPTIAAATQAYVGAVNGESNASALADAASAKGRAQGAIYWSRLADLTKKALGDPQKLGLAICEAHLEGKGYLAAIADLLMQRFAELPADARRVVLESAALYPARYRTAARRLLSSGATGRAALGAGTILETVGTEGDIASLRQLARRRDVGCGALGLGLIRRLAPRVHVDDLGPVCIHVGQTLITGSTVRRKVLSLLCFLLTRHKFSATCEEVIDALWPGLDQGTAMNSLNQSVYFLRRVFEPSYREETSAGYVRHEGELIGLDPDLVGCQSAKCVRLISAAGGSATNDLVRDLQAEYAGPFALDFAYEDWASAFRNHLHAAYLSIVEQAVASNTDTGRFDVAITMAQRAIQVDPDADQIEVSLLRLYKLTGAHAAAAEQYEHYAAFVRDQLGVEPPTLEAL